MGPISCDGSYRLYGIDHDGAYRFYGIDFDNGAKSVGTNILWRLINPWAGTPPTASTSPRPPRETSSSRAETINETIEQSINPNNRSIQPLPPPATGKSNHGRLRNRLRRTRKAIGRNTLSTSIGPTPQYNVGGSPVPGPKGIFQTAFRVPRSGFPRDRWSTTPMRPSPQSVKFSSSLK